MSKQTAVEWLENELIERYNLINSKPLFEQAKEMEKQQILDAWEDGHDSFSTRSEEQYYDETFNK